MPNNVFSLDDLRLLVHDYFSSQYDLRLFADLTSNTISFKAFKNGVLLKHKFSLREWSKHVADGVQYHQLENIDGEFVRQLRELVLQKPQGKGDSNLFK